MAHKNLQDQEYTFQYRRFHINKSQPLGCGSYGAVYKAKCDQLPCAAKILHPTILDPKDPGAGKVMQRFQQECALLERIRHPNIVQYLCMTMDPESKLPVLLMELLDESLTKMLEHSQKSLTCHVQTDLCHDIALAVAYLHSNHIIHRDLSSNNVLIIAGRRAKVTDFGMSKLIGAAPTRTPLTMCPGTLAYMPPEALREPPRYTKKLDIFSEGVIMIQVCTQVWPEPGPRTQLVKDSRYPTGTIEVPVPEIERRKNHIDMINPSHILLRTAVDCLNYQENERPSSEELCQRLAGLKECREYRESVQQQQDEIQDKDNQIISQAQQLREKDRALQQKIDEIQSKDYQLQEKDRIIQQQSSHFQEERVSLERQLRQLNHELKEKERVSAEIQQIYRSFQRHMEHLRLQLSQFQEESTSQENQLCHLNQEPKEKEQVSGEIQQIYHSLQRQVEQLELQLNQRSSQPLPSQVQVREQSPPSPQANHPSKITLNWSDRGKVPFKIERGAAVVNGNIAYFIGCNGKVYSYNSTRKRWHRLPECPYKNCSLVVISSKLTAIGGREDVFGKSTNKLVSLHDKNMWTEVLPPMPTKRYDTAAATTKGYLVVAGGRCRGDVVHTVEVMDISTQTPVWSTAASLPHPYSYASAIICGDHFYMLGGCDGNGKTKSVLTCSLTELLQSSLSPSPVWNRSRVADTPDFYSTGATINGELLAVGGCDGENQATFFIYKYSPTSNSWDLISNMPTARFSCLVAVLPTNEMMVVGANTERYLTAADEVEIASIGLS